MARCSFGLAVFFTAVASLAAVGDPVAVAVRSNGEVVVVDRIRGLFVVGGRTPLHPVSTFGVFEPVDFAPASTGGDTYFVSLVVRVASDTSFSRLVRYTLAGRKTGEWPLQQGGRIAGVAVDASQQVVYCSDSRSGQVYQLDLNRPNAALTTFATVRDAGSLGSVVFDARGQRLLVADIEKNRILAIRLRDKHVDVLVQDAPFTEPSALALDPDRNRLFVADAARRRLWVVGLTAPMAVTAFAPRESFREPVSIALSPGGASLWVADRGQRQLTQLSADGRLLRRLSL
jgi:sugar lactone lactonase YvrE